MSLCNRVFTVPGTFFTPTAVRVLRTEERILPTAEQALRRAERILQPAVQAMRPAEITRQQAETQPVEAQREEWQTPGAAFLTALRPA